MQIRPATAADLKMLPEIDGTIESTEYLHLDCIGEDLARGWKLEPRPLRNKLIESNTMNDEQRFDAKQIIDGITEGVALVAEHDDLPVGLALAQLQAELGTLKLIDLRVDYDHRRQGIATVMLYQMMQIAKDRELRAVAAETRTNNAPASRLMQKVSFQMSGIDTRRHSNHDMVKESATIFWYAVVD